MVNDPAKFDFVISFISIGTGIDQTSHNRFAAYLASLTNEVTCQTIHWGMEGEVDYCINLNVGSEDLREKIRTKFMAIQNGSRRVTISLNAPCSHLRQGK